MRSWTRISALALYGTLIVTMQAIAQEALPVAQSADPPAAELQQLVAPIALYPDELVGQVVTAATYPTEVVDAWRWLQEHPVSKARRSPARSTRSRGIPA